MSPKHSSLAFDETLKEMDLDLDTNFEPNLQVIVNAHYSKASCSLKTSSDVVEITGRVTVSF